MTVSAPEPLAAHHVTDGFSSGTGSLDHWLRTRAWKNQVHGATRTYVACGPADQVVAYYALASGAVAVPHATGRLRRNMPDPVPVVLLGRLAVDHRWQGRGLGRGLVRDAALRVLQAASAIGVRGLLVQALSYDAKAFYEAVGFEASPIDPMLLMVTLGDLQASLEAPARGPMS